MQLLCVWFLLVFINPSLFVCGRDWRKIFEQISACGEWQMEKVQWLRLLGSVCLIIVFLFAGTGEAQSKSFLISCGTNSSVTVDGRKWIGDLAPGNNVTLSSPGVAASTADSVSAPLYKTARFITSSMNYTFEGTQGSYFLRLHFYPFSFQGQNANESSFDVVANGMKLLSNVNVPSEILLKSSQGLGDNSSLLIKEYFLNINLGVLLIGFIPAKGSFGFVNALELVPVSAQLFAESVSRVGGNGAGSNLNLRERGFETMYRLNVGGPEIKSNQDIDLWRKWETDFGYMFRADTGSEIRNSSNITYASLNDTSVAPLLVYETARIMSEAQVLDKRFNMSWKFDVDPDFDYVVRLHFCELVFGKPNERRFRIFINNQTAADSFDVFVQAGGINKAFHQDYLDVVSSKINTLWIQLGPDPSAAAAASDALLNGLEIFKLSRDGNLASTSQKFESNGNSRGNRSSKTRVLLIVLGVGFASLAALAVLAGLIFCNYKKWRKESGDTKVCSSKWRPLFLHGAIHKSSANIKDRVGNLNLNGSLASTRTGRRFTLAEIRAATNNFDDSLVIGEGGFGKVYKGETDDGSLAAIKRAHPQSQQGLREFETEIEMLSKLRHRHLVSMIGFCEEQNEMILVYEYMANGTLRSHLFGSDLPPPSWKQRLQACIGAARGLHYLHTGAERGIIHRDVKTTNILLDDSFVAKMADFGLSKTGPSLEHTHVSTAVKGSFGYLDPEYFRRQQLTEKSDVYSFGVVLFEVVCARAVINPSLPRDQINLAEWAIQWQREKSLETIVDPHLKEKYCPESLEKFGEIAEKCLADEGKQRPTMGEVLWHLEYVLQIHEAWMHGNNVENSISSCQDLGNSEAIDTGRQQCAELDTEMNLNLKEKDGVTSNIDR